MVRIAVLVCLFVCLQPVARAQKKSAIATSSLCTRDNAIDTAKQQILQSRTLDDVVQRIAVLIRAADLLWPHEQDKALAAFIDALDLAGQNFKENGDQTKRVSQSRLPMMLPDQRFKVLSALARRDPARARKLSEQILQDDTRAAADKPSVDEQSQRRAGEKLLTMAFGLAPTDPASAVAVARQSLRFPASMSLSMFLYQLARTNKPAADQFYAEALVAYGSSPMDQFLYLSAYPFGNTRDSGQMQSSTYYAVPKGYVPSRELQGRFIRTLLQRSERAPEMREDPENFRYPEQAQIWLALTRLEKQVQENLPDLAESTTRAKDRLFALLHPTTQQRVAGEIATENAPRKSFDEQVEWAEKVKDEGRRDQLLSSAVTSSAKDQPAEKVLSVIDKISDSGVRAPLLNWFYYFRAQALIADKNLGEAKEFASRVTELDQRAYLFTRIAEESLKLSEDQTEARQMLNEVADAVSKAPKTIVSARALLALAHLYAKIDMNRGIEELGNAVRTINALESPDFSFPFVMMKIEGKTFGSYFTFPTPGFNPENAFREMGKIDFDGSLAQATAFTDKSLRALTTLSVIEPCFATKTRKASK